MKKIIISILTMVMSVTAMAQTDVWIWQKGMPVKMEAVDSITFTDPLGKEYVDLGLSVKWATCNIGATKPWVSGYYFAWGETEPKETYSRDTYKWITLLNGGYKFTKYCSNSNAGNADGLQILEPEDDAATVYWGEEWRMPTKAEGDELLNNCTWEWQPEGNAAFNGVAGYKVTSNKTGYTDKYIFFPAAGYISSQKLSYSGERGYVWTSSVYTTPNFAYYINMNSGKDVMYNIYDYRYCGFPVRAVLP